MMLRDVVLLFPLVAVACSDPPYSTTGHDITKYITLDVWLLYGFNDGVQREILEVEPGEDRWELGWSEEVGGPLTRGLVVIADNQGLSVEAAWQGGEWVAMDPPVSLGTRSMVAGQSVQSLATWGGKSVAWTTTLVGFETVTTPYNEPDVPFVDVARLVWDDGGVNTGLSGTYLFASGIGPVGYQREGSTEFLLDETGDGSDP